MKRIFTILIILLFNIVEIFSQPSNSNCDGLVDLGFAPSCKEQIHNNIDAAAFDILFDNEPGCFQENPPQNDVWFSFTSDSEITDYIIELKPIQDIERKPIENMQMALYRGICGINSMALRDCAAAESGDSVLVMDVLDLSPGQRFFIRVDSYGDDESEGHFTICIREKSNEQTITESGSSACSGVLFDSGGPFNNYTNGESNTFTICPEEVFQCLQINLEYYNLAQEHLNSADKLVFYEGTNTNGEILATLGPNINNETAHSGGGVCFSIQSAACVTVQFISNSDNTSEGFKASWQCSIIPCEESSTISISSQVSEEDVRDALSTQTADVQLDTIRCASGALSVFEDNAQDELGIQRGILMSTGLALDALGPNTLPGTSHMNNTPGDADLDSLSAIGQFQNNLSFDACVVELDVLAYSNELSFEYIFASEEYPEFINSDFNDIFALLISGPGIEDGIAEIGGQKNMAVLPDEKTPVQINSVNHKTNWEHYRNNSFGKGLEYDGITSGLFGQKKSLTARATVIPCNSYHLKFAIADRGDSNFDSGVFISEISSSFPAIQADLSGGVDYLVEGCSGDQNTIRFLLNNPFKDSLQYLLKVAGSADKSIDYKLDLPEVLQFNPGETEILFSLNVMSDSLPEKDEEIIIELYNPTPCDTVLVDVVTISIKDKVVIDFPFEGDSISICQDSPFAISVTGAESYSWQPHENITNPFSASIQILPDSNRWYLVQGGLGTSTLPNCLAKDSIYVQSINPDFDIYTSDDTDLCTGDSIIIHAQTNATTGHLSWSTEVGTIFPKEDLSAKIIVTNAGTDIPIAATLAISQCKITDSLFVNADRLVIPASFANDTTICKGQSTRLATEVATSNTSYSWLPATGLDNAFIASATATPSETTTYQLTAESPRKYCLFDTSLIIQVLSSQIEINAPDTLNLCQGNTLNLSANIETISSEATVEWSPTDLLISEQGGDSASFLLSSNGSIAVTLFDSICVQKDQIYVEIDSLPNLEIQAIPNQNIYCKDEIISLISPPFDNRNFINVQTIWEPVAGTLSDLNALNIVIQADSTTTFRRRIFSDFCEDIDSIVLPVLDPQLEIIVEDSIICQNEDLSAQVESPQTLDSIQWNVLSECINENCDQVILSITENINVIATGFLSSCQVADTLPIEVESFQLNIESQQQGPVPLGSEIALFAFLREIPAKDITVQWYLNGELQDMTSQNIQFKTANAQNEIIAIWISEEGCIYADTLLIEGSLFEIEFPNVFRPESLTEMNRSFSYVIKIEENYFDDAQFEVIDFNIYNRWGNRVFSCSDRICAKPGWDGTHEGKEQPGDIYIYHFKAKLPDDTLLQLKGDVLLIR